ncbi:hypothetical protein OE88DRAFT_1664584 [Heliocybe sulcata]|uniref:Uncharacterized protein n=1 Tax=Heliocybe sulcata TaxID=5364 RepID=A0A5C3MTM2_9AGAM|nr:hypothetical protein OE88DRAFT_1664584 [Heliocybe sulcata]
MFSPRSPIPAAARLFFCLVVIARYLTLMRPLASVASQPLLGELDRGVSDGALRTTRRRQ